MGQAVESVVSNQVPDLRTGLGVLMLSGQSSMRFMNQRARELVQQINEAAPVQAGGAVLSPVITKFISEIKAIIPKKTDVEYGKQSELRRTAGSDERPVLLRGFGIPANTRSQETGILIVFESFNRRLSRMVNVKDRFQLTSREERAITNLLKGWTNKEIACEMDISEAAVKTHMNKIMKKMGVSTRTAILVRIFDGEGSSRPR